MIRATLRALTLAVAAAAALFAAIQSWANGARIDALQGEVAELRGELRTTSDTGRAHVTAAGLHR